ncbi:emp24p/erv25p- protein [Thoreauomyces humboldtii]|nr:emp24p/erv25p- protein [Thoreauomyces humboldtii]
MASSSRPASLLVLLLLLSLFAAQANALYFYLEGSKQRCFFEELPGETTVVGNYKSEELSEASGLFAPNPERGLQINVEQVDNKHRVLNQRGADSGKFVFSTADAGEYSICLYENHPSRPLVFCEGSVGNLTVAWFTRSQIHFIHRMVLVRLHLDLMFGEATHDNQPDLKKETLSDLALRIRELNVKIANVRREQVYQKEREAEFRNTSEAANAHIRNWTLAQLVVLGLTCLWQIRHLKNFFVAKKLV